MAPEFIINGKYIAGVPDESGTYEIPDGKITVDMNGISPDSEVQILGLSGEIFDGSRQIPLAPKGTGSQTLSGRRKLEVSLYTPIRTQHRQKTRSPEGPEVSHFPDDRVYQGGKVSM